MKELVESITEIEVRGLENYPSILKKILKVQKLTENRLIISLVFDHVIRVIVP